ncbi:hypothetical protein [Halomonas borealis]|uniref:hypothetical protein n=1 Tax=Halomonas borealis TaxID=2508710 RepID=UPI00109F3758|nr:hypothetical protein [Halomonas borealis]
MPDSPSERIALRALCLRGFAYMLFIAALMQGVLFEAMHMPAVRFSEAGFTELTQSALLIGATTLALITHRLDDRLPHLTLLLVGLLGASLIREQDAWLDANVFDGAWQLLVTLLVVPILYAVLRGRRTLAAELERYAMSFSGGLFAAGFLGTYVFSRLYGRGELWTSLLGEHDLRIVKDAAEEVTELFGYALLLIAMLELLLMVRRWARSRDTA